MSKGVFNMRGDNVFDGLFCLFRRKSHFDKIKLEAVRLIPLIGLL